MASTVQLIHFPSKTLHWHPRNEFWRNFSNDNCFELKSPQHAVTLDRKRLKIHFLFLFVKVTVVEWTKLFINHFFWGGVAPLVWPCKKIICLDIFHDQFWQPYFMSMCKNKLKRGLQLYVWHKLFFLLQNSRPHKSFYFCFLLNMKTKIMTRHCIHNFIFNIFSTQQN